MAGFAASVTVRLGIPALTSAPATPTRLPGCSAIRISGGG